MFQRAVLATAPRTCLRSAPVKRRSPWLALHAPRLGSTALAWLWVAATVSAQPVLHDQRDIAQGAASVTPGVSQPRRFVPASTPVTQASVSAPAAFTSPCQRTEPEGALDLHQAIRLALCHDPRTRMSAAAVQGQWAELASERMRRWPQAAAEVAAGHAVQRERNIDYPNVRHSGVASEATLALQWLLYDFGQQALRESVAARALQVAKAQHDETTEQVVLELVVLYQEAVEAQAHWQQLRESERFMRGLLGEALQPSRRGAKPIDRKGELQARTALTRRQLDLRSAGARWSRARGELALRIGLEAAGSLQVPEPAYAAPPLELERDMAALVERVAASRPAVQVAQARVAQAEAQLALAERAGRPEISAVHEWRHRREPPSDRSAGRQFGLKIDIPLGALSDKPNQIKRASSQLDAAHGGLQQSRHELAVSLWQAYQSWREHRVAVVLAERFHVQAVALQQAELQAFRRGDSDLSDVLDAQDSILEAAEARLRHATGLAVSGMRLAIALGLVELKGLGP